MPDTNEPPAEASGPDTGEEEFRIELSWPVHDEDAAPVSGPRAEDASEVGPSAPGSPPADTSVSTAAEADHEASDQRSTVPPVSAVPVQSTFSAPPTPDLHALALRIEALVSATAGMRNAISERLNDQSETVSRLVRGQSADLEEHRHATDRALAEVRRATGDADEAVRRVSTRLDEVAAEVGAVSELLRANVDDSRGLASSSEKLSRQVTEGLEAFGDRLMERVDDLDSAVSGDLTSVRNETSALRARLEEARAAPPPEPDLRWLREELDRLSSRLGSLSGNEELRQPLEDLAGRVGAVEERLAEPLVLQDDEFGDALAALRTDVVALRQSVETLSEHDDAAALRADLTALRAAVDEMAEHAADTDWSVELVNLRAELAKLRGDLDRHPDDGGAERLASLHAEVSDLKAQWTAWTEQTATQQPPDLEPIRAQLASIQESQQRLGEAAEAIRRLEESVELVSEGEAVATEPPVIAREEWQALRDKVAGLGQLSGELAALRHDIAGWARTAEDVAALRDEVGALATPADQIDALRREVQGQAPQLQALHDEVSGLGAAVRDSRPSRELEGLHDELASLTEAVTAGSTNQPLAELRSEIAALSQAFRAADPSPQLADVEDQLAALSEQLQQEQRRPLQQMADLHDQLGVLSDAVGKAVSTEALSELRAEVHTLAENLERNDPSRSLGGVKRDVAALRRATSELHAALSSALADGRDRDVVDELRLLRERVDALVETSASQSDRRTLAAIAELRAAVERWEPVAPEPKAPEPVTLEPVEVDLSEVTAALGGLGREVASLRREMRQAAPSTSGAPAAAVTNGSLEAMTSELKALRRRLNLRAKPEATTLEQGQLEQLAGAVAARLREMIEIVPEDSDA